MDENDIVTAILKDPGAQDALRFITRIAIREIALRSNSSPPVEDMTVIGNMTIDRLRRTVTVKGQVRPIKPREFALLETLARRPGIVFSRERLHCARMARRHRCDRPHRRRPRCATAPDLRRKTANIRTVPGVGYAIDPPADE